jgi:opacity protein-like surface antigen
MALNKGLDMKIRVFTFVSMTTVLSGQLMAESLWPILETKNCSPLITLSLGPAWTSRVNTHEFHIRTTTDNVFNYNRQNEVTGAGEVFVGWQAPINLNLLGQVGVVLAGTLNTPINGNIWQADFTSPTRYAYRYDVNHRHAALKLKMTTDTNTVVQPYLSGAVGMGSNQASHLTIRPNVTSLDLQPIPLSTNNHNAFVYSLGIGIQTAYNQNWYLGFGYEFANWGGLQLSAATGNSYNTRINTERLYANQLLFSLTYVFTSQVTRD